ncbi:stage III sporulation protein AG [Cytobacillus sp. S13-E01]|uniref:stage III sporulation protein AG n=1 Tax=Cytobacillus sp. S13-E01 TaxID=3031326 RepID=UPI0023D889F7|nr:stage III sporulation protein AG [Cytobacillus sp. S13-E01]MDF0727337.1 stage III sporulation protein AG [Cytobacillus sp. S13-E01]
MGKEQGLLNSIKKMFFQSKGDQTDPPEKKPPKYHYLLLVLTLGVVFMLLSNLFNNGETKQQTIPTSTQQNSDEPAFGQKEEAEKTAISEYEIRYENQLKEALETIIGVSDVTVFVNVDSTETKVLEKNTVTNSQLTDETDREGGKRKVEDTSKDEQVVIIRQGDKETPIVLKIEKPTIRGVLVVAKGADNIQIKKMVVEAVTRALDVPSHRVAVLPKKD